MPILKKNKDSLTIAELQEKGYDVPSAAIEALNETFKKQKEFSERLQKTLRPDFLKALNQMTKSIDFKALKIQADKIKSIQNMFAKEYQRVRLLTPDIQIEPIRHVNIVQKQVTPEYREEYIIEGVSNRLFKKMEASANHFRLYYTEDGRLYADENAKHIAKWNKGERAYRVFGVLLEDRPKYTETEDLTRRANLPHERATRDVIKKIRQKLKKLRLPKDLIDSERLVGYRIDLAFQVIELKK